MIIEQLYQLYSESYKVSTDTRDIAPDSVFFALKGERFNANKFAGQALERGARWAVVDEALYAADERCILVNDVLTTLQELARYHRSQLAIPVVGITGTNGKTTTKELLHAVLSQRFKTHATKGNLNNHIGVPLTLLSIDKTVEMAIVEMGANHQQEIAFLCDIARPTHGIITNVGKAHLEGFGSFDGVKKAKGELYDFLKESKGVLFVQGDNADLQAMEKQRGIARVVRYGFSEKNDIVGQLEPGDALLCVSWKKRNATVEHRLQTQLVGSYNAENILAAIAVGDFFGLDATDINRGMTAYTPTNNRSQVVKTAQNTLIADYYNANVSSMEAALSNIKAIHGANKVLVLGDMFELGADTEKEHRSVIRKAEAVGADRTIFVGEAFYAQRSDRNAEFYKTTSDAKEALRKRPITGSTILLKASRGMAFEKLVEVL